MEFLRATPRFRPTSTTLQSNLRGVRVVSPTYIRVHYGTTPRPQGHAAHQFINLTDLSFPLHLASSRALSWLIDGEVVSLGVADEEQQQHRKRYGYGKEDPLNNGVSISCCIKPISQFQNVSSVTGLVSRQQCHDRYQG